MPARSNAIVNSGVPLPEPAERARHQVADETLAEHDVDMAAFEPLQLAQLGDGVGLIGLPLPEALDQQHPGLGRADAAAEPLDERQPELLFQQRDLPADHRGVDLERFCRCAHRAEPNGLVKVTQPMMIEQGRHGRSEVLP
ncbi:hypothetical protein ACVILH_004116 [Bradyrhizobium sp. USDA 4353]